MLKKSDNNYQAKNKSCFANNRYTCSHLGFAIKRELTIIYDSKKETAKTGDTYYFPPRNPEMAIAGTEVWKFSPADKLKKTCNSSTEICRRLRLNKSSYRRQLTFCKISMFELQKFMSFFRITDQPVFCCQNGHTL